MPVVGNFRCHCLHPVGEGRLCEQQVEVDDRLKAADDSICFFAASARQFSKDSFDLILFLGLEDADFIVGFDDSGRFDKVG